MENKYDLLKNVDLFLFDVIECQCFYLSTQSLRS